MKSRAVQPDSIHCSMGKTCIDAKIKPHYLTVQTNTNICFSEMIAHILLQGDLVSAGFEFQPIDELLQSI